MRILFLLALAIGAFFFLGWCFMLLWNASMPFAFDGANEIAYGPALALTALLGTFVRASK